MAVSTGRARMPQRGSYSRSPRTVDELKAANPPRRYGFTVLAVDVPEPPTLCFIDETYEFSE